MSVQQNEVKISSVSTEGMDGVFEAVDTPAPDSTTREDSTGLIDLRPTDSPTQDWTVSEAAKELGVSEKTVLRRLQRGVLRGYKVAGQFGPEWRINREATDKPAQDTVTALPKPAQVRDTGGDSEGQDTVVQELKEEIAALRYQLEGAIYRNGYLEAKLEERESTIKLLTDSQHKSGWWNRFSAWLGR